MKKKKKVQSKSVCNRRPIDFMGTAHLSLEKKKVMFCVGYLILTVSRCSALGYRAKSDRLMDRVISRNIFGFRFIKYLGLSPVIDKEVVGNTAKTSTQANISV